MKRACQVSPDGWGRARLLLVLVAVCAAAAVLLAGLGYAVWAAASTTPGPARLAGHDTSAGTAKVGMTGRDRIAAAPMLPVSAEDAQPAPPAAAPAPDIEITDPTNIGPAGVPVGFPHTPEGALGQLAAIEVAVLQEMSISRALQVHQSWALPGAVPADWELTADVRTFLGAARMGAVKDPVAVITATAAGAQVKGVDGPDWLLACVLLDVRATITMEARVGYGHCERMQWHAGRWMIAAGLPPAPAPSTWPGTPTALQAGWRTWTPGPGRAR
jgi:hypothetical protein